MTSSSSVYAIVADLLRSRHTVRRFLPTPVSREQVAELLELASVSPSGANAQPWKVYALAGAEKAALSAALVQSFERGEVEAREYDYYPESWSEPWLTRRRKLGFDLYGAIGIAKGDKPRMREQTARNLLFFDAPVGLIFTMDRRLAQGMFLDYGIFIAHLVVAAEAQGLSTCIQTAFAEFPATVHRQLGIGDGELIVGGLSLGYADPQAPENALRTERAPLEQFAAFRGFF